MIEDTQTRIWEPEMLDRFPLDSNAMVHDLAPGLLGLLLAYVAEATLGGTIPAVLAAIADRYPKHLRVKELFETIEAYKRIGQAIYERWRVGAVETVYDLACGHGLLGILLACRFPKVKIVCVDLERRPAFDSYMAVARDYGMRLENVMYVEGDLRDVVFLPRSYVICIHACNEATRIALGMALEAGACFAAMPCCIRDGIYLDRVAHVDDRTRYAASVGVIAGMFGAYKITAIDERITNRHLIVLGGPRG